VDRFVCQEEKEDSANMFLRFAYSELFDVFSNQQVIKPTMRTTFEPAVDENLHFEILDEHGILCKKGIVDYCNRSRNPYTAQVMFIAYKKAKEHKMTADQKKQWYFFSHDFKDFDWSKYRP